ncbi:uncharacterized protein LOC111243713 isoform X2 [Varroa destructor]|uniref:Uncharacterized protein n=1 Tax=Varroa destructor TaxID=109461 RepID=A0A7M7JAW4_VARDE|nr:uncharacterized protein LOC111243713 isoform X2 [Varroa destructor]
MCTTDKKGNQRNIENATRTPSPQLSPPSLAGLKYNFHNSIWLNALLQQYATTLLRRQQHHHGRLSHQNQQRSERAKFQQENDQQDPQRQLIIVTTTRHSLQQLQDGQQQHQPWHSQLNSEEKQRQQQQQRLLLEEVRQFPLSIACPATGQRRTATAVISTMIFLTETILRQQRHLSLTAKTRSMNKAPRRISASISAAAVFDYDTSIESTTAIAGFQVAPIASNLTGSCVVFDSSNDVHCLQEECTRNTAANSITVRSTGSPNNAFTTAPATKIGTNYTAGFGTMAIFFPVGSKANADMILPISIATFTRTNGTILTEKTASKRNSTTSDSHRTALNQTSSAAREARPAAIIVRGDMACIAVVDQAAAKSVDAGTSFRESPARLSFSGHFCRQDNYGNDAITTIKTTAATARTTTTATAISQVFKIEISACNNPLGYEPILSDFSTANHLELARDRESRKISCTSAQQSRPRRMSISTPTITWTLLMSWLTLGLVGLVPDGIGLGLPGAAASREAKRLFDDLLSDYNRLIRPVGNNSHKVVITVGLKLSQLIDINLKHQVMTTNIWLEQEWEDYKLKWNPAEYGGVDMIHVPAENIWLPDIVLFNNADGNYEVILMNKATVYSTGKVVWKPPALYKSTCEIDVEYFPFDEQNCLMKFASWTYDGFEVDLLHQKQKPGETEVSTGIDMSEFYKSVEWDILLVPAKYNQGKYDCCVEPFPDITFNITMRRKTLFYTVNLIIPCVGISFLTVLVFYLPSDSGEKVTLCISILVSLTVFFLLLAEIIPPTSLAVPLLGKYLLFTMILVTLSISVTVGVLNVHFRSPSTHKMSPWVRRVFIHIMPRLLLMRRPNYNPVPDEEHHKYTLQHRAHQQLLQQQRRIQQQQQREHQPQPPQQPPADCNGVELNYRESMLRVTTT